ncbi:MAG TPA: ADP-ribosylglycohydrolase family protein [Candidatus Humimicrobiaceae bacterium]
MLGAIAGDVIGSIYEFNNIDKSAYQNFELFSDESNFTDDTVLTVATAQWILDKCDLAKKYKRYYRAYPGRGYGARFCKWAGSKSYKPYNSFGNGSAMRVSPISFAYNNIEDVLSYAKASAEVTHNHPEGIKGAQAAAAAGFFARCGKNKEFIKKYIENKFEYNLDEPIESISKYYVFDESCQGTVPQAIRVFLESENFEDAIRKAMYIGGDSDTIACIAGGIAENFYGGVPQAIKEKIFKILDPGLVSVIKKFYKKYDF